MSGLLIVNGDDWGLNAGHTDAILACMEAGVVSSATAMVFMAGEAHGAALGAGRDLPLGLHLNLIEPFDGPDVPPLVRETQAEVTRHLTDARSARWLYRPGLAPLIRATVEHQFARFRELYGREPTHMDGHRHMHLAPTALLAGAYPPGIRMRRPFTFERGEKRWPLRAARHVIGRHVAHRYRTTDFMYGLDDVWPAMGGRAMERKLARARDGAVEIMVHPGYRADRDVLMSAAWTDAVAGLRLGSFDDLPDAAGRPSVQSVRRLR